MFINKFTTLIITVFLGLICLLINPMSAEAVTFPCTAGELVTNPANRHNYCLTNPGKWTEAKAEAIAAGGNLITINDQAEQDWVLQTFGNTNRYWIGFTDENIEGNFEWVSDTTTSYENWLPGEPNNGYSYADEHYTSMNWNEKGSWNDINNNGIWSNCNNRSQFPDRDNSVENPTSVCESGFIPLAGIVEIEPTGGVIKGMIWNDINGDGDRDNGLEIAVVNVKIYLDLNQNGALDDDEPTQRTNSDGEYIFTGLEADTYIVREVNPTGFKQTYPAKETKPGNGYADVILDFSDSGAGPIPGPYGINGGLPEVLAKKRYNIEVVKPDVVLGAPPPSPIIVKNPEVDFLTLPRGASVTVGFNDEMIIDGPGDDILIHTVDKRSAANENADIFVSADGINFTFLGRVNARGRLNLDLASIRFTEAVKALKVVGVDQLGGIPGFDLVSVEALPGSVSYPEFHTVTLGEGATVENINFGIVLCPSQKSKFKSQK